MNDRERPFETLELSSARGGCRFGVFCKRSSPSSLIVALVSFFFSCRLLLAFFPVSTPTTHTHSRIKHSNAPRGLKQLEHKRDTHFLLCCVDDYTSRRQTVHVRINIMMRRICVSL